MYIRPVLYAAGVVAVMSAVWMMVVQPRLDLAEAKNADLQRQNEGLLHTIERQREQIDDYIAENKRRAKIEQELHSITQRIDRSLDVTLSNIRRYAREAPDPNLLACFDMPVADFHTRVRASDEAATRD